MKSSAQIYYYIALTRRATTAKVKETTIEPNLAEPADEEKPQTVESQQSLSKLKVSFTCASINLGAHCRNSFIWVAQVEHSSPLAILQSLATKGSVQSLAEYRKLYVSGQVV